jgi:hypothetical protein
MGDVMPSQHVIDREAEEVMRLASNKYELAVKEQSHEIFKKLSCDII